MTSRVSRVEMDKWGKEMREKTAKTLVEARKAFEKRRDQGRMSTNPVAPAFSTRLELCVTCAYLHAFLSVLFCSEKFIGSGQTSELFAYALFVLLLLSRASLLTTTLFSSSIHCLSSAFSHSLVCVQPSQRSVSQRRRSHRLHHQSRGCARLRPSSAHFLERTIGRRSGSVSGASQTKEGNKRGQIGDQAR